MRRLFRICQPRDRPVVRLRVPGKPDRTARIRFYPSRIDRSFISTIYERQDDVEIASAIISMAQSPGLTTIAEGVETQPQYELLRTLGCHQIQGYLTSRSLPEEEILKMPTRS